MLSSKWQIIKSGFNIFTSGFTSISLALIAPGPFASNINFLGPSAITFKDKDLTFKTISVTESVRDTMHTVKINPITFFSGAGIVNFGNLTKVSGSSALDRINVSRLTVYLRTQLDAVAKPFIFEPNDELTRNEIKQAIESFLLELVGQRALYDFLVVCDDTNNTPTRIDRNELYVDIAIEPVKSVEFIYIPLRIKNTGEIAKLGN